MAFLAFESKINWSFKIDPTLAADIGTYLAGTSGTLWGAAGLIVLIQTLAVQQEGIQQQRDIFNQQSFETTFFNTLKSFKEDLSKLPEDYKNCFTKELYKFLGYKPKDHRPIDLGKRIYSLPLSYVNDSTIKEKLIGSSPTPIETQIVYFFYNILSIIENYPGSQQIYHELLCRTCTLEVVNLALYYGLIRDGNNFLEILQQSSFCYFPESHFHHSHMDFFKSQDKGYYIVIYEKDLCYCSVHCPDIPDITIPKCHLKDVTSTTKTSLNAYLKKLKSTNRKRPSPNLAYQNIFDRHSKDENFLLITFVTAE